MRFPLASLALSLTVGASFAWAAPGHGYFRYPAIHGDTVVFTAEGDLWSVGASGGRAARLTTHPGEESRAAISPDGAWVAFTAVYDGPQEAYVMPVGGGLPRRVSFEGGRSQVLGWTPRQEVLYSTQNPLGPNGQKVLVAVVPGTLKRRVLPLADANDACVDATGDGLYFSRMGLAITGDNARNYRGGAAAELWRFDLKGEGEATRLPIAAQARRPMWWDGRLYFVSDQDGTDNLWSARGDGSDLRQLTHHQGWDIRYASLGDGRIVYQLGADLRIFDLKGADDRALEIELGSDFDQERERMLAHPLNYLEGAHLAPGGDRVAFTARGRVAVAGLGPARCAELALPSGSRARAATLSQDGKWVYAFCDATGESELWRFPADGRPGGKALTEHGTAGRAELLESPDGKWIAHTDQAGHLWLLDVATLENRLLDTSHRDGYSDLVWSGDSRTLAVVRPDSSRQVTQIVLLGLEGGKPVVLTSDKYESHSPAFSPDGKWLYFLSERSFEVKNRSPWGDRNMGPYFDDRTQIYAVALQEGTSFPFSPKDELTSAPKPAAAAPKAGKVPEALPAIQWTGLAQRLYQVPLAAGNYTSLKTDGKRLYFLEREAESELGGVVKSLDVEDAGAPAEIFSTGVKHFELSADGRKLFLQQGEGQPEFLIVDAGAKAPAQLAKAQVRLQDWNLALKPAAEWHQMFGDAWRMHRDHLFDVGMRGQDWKAIRAKYEPLVDRVTDRAELNDLLAQMMGEVSTLHSQVQPGELRKAPEGSTPAFLGAVLEREGRGYRVQHRYLTDPERPSEAGPLSQPGTPVREGDLILSVNGRPLDGEGDLAEGLRNQAGHQALLGLRRGNEDFKAVVTPVNADRNASLRYSDWEESRRAEVEKLGGGSLGYLHLKAMGSRDINDFAREFYANINRDGLIIDVRRNNGGNIDSWIIEKLLRRTWAFWSNREHSLADANMQQTFRGHLVVLIDELTYSDGETFAAGIKELGLAPLVGRRTAGAGVWLSDRNSLVDWGMARAAEGAQFLARNGEWMIEGKGVAPDVEVLNLPHETFLGRDRQLETAIQMLKDKLAKAPIAPLVPPSFGTTALLSPRSGSVR